MILSKTILHLEYVIMTSAVKLRILLTKLTESKLSAKHTDVTSTRDSTFSWIQYCILALE